MTLIYDFRFPRCYQSTSAYKISTIFDHQNIICLYILLSSKVSIDFLTETLLGVKFDFPVRNI